MPSKPRNRVGEVYGKLTVVRASERQRRIDAKQRRAQLQGKVPDGWLSLPLTDAHARELGQVLFFRGTLCLRGHLAPYRINGGCLTCSGQKPSAAD